MMAPFKEDGDIYISPFDLLPSETLTTILQHTAADCGIHSLLALSATSHRLHKIYHIHRISLLASAIDCTYGPLQDIINLITYNSSQPVHVDHHVPMSITLLRNTLSVGRIARRWEEIYPFKKWQGENSIHRRLLTDMERRRLRRAVYHIWLYDRAFHTPLFPGITRNRPELVAVRTRLVQCWNTLELAEVMDMQRVFRRVLAHNVCPINAKVQRKVQQRYGDQYAMNLLFNTTGTMQPSGALHGMLPGVTHHQHRPLSHHRSRYMMSARHDPALEGFGDDIGHYYKINDMLKLNPQHILHLYENTFGKAQVDSYVENVATNTENNYVWPSWFHNNGETLEETVERWLVEHNVDFLQMEQDIANGVIGVATSEQ